MSTPKLKRPPFVTVFRPPDVMPSDTKKPKAPPGRMPRIRLYNARKRPKVKEKKSEMNSKTHLPPLSKNKPILSPSRSPNNRNKKEIVFKLPDIEHGEMLTVSKFPGRRPSFEDPLPRQNSMENYQGGRIVKESSASDSISLVSIPENPMHLGLGATMWLHKFVYNSRRKSVAEEEREEVSERVALSHFTFCQAEIAP